MARDRSLEDMKMKKTTLIAGIASVAALAAVWSVPASAGTWTATDREPVRDYKYSTDVAPTSAPEPGTLGMLALGLSSLGFIPRRRK
jgi:hypothetical protein